MKNSKSVKIILIITISLIILLVTKSVLAVSNFTDLTNTVSGNNTSSLNSANNSATNNTTNNTKNNTSSNNVLTTNNTSNYNNSSLPKTGVESSIPSVILVVVFTISAVYAYKKIQDYKNI